MHLSIAVPAACGNNCKFCIARMNKVVYSNHSVPSMAEADYMKRMAYARDAGCTSLTLTGEGEPMMNRKFLEFISRCNSSLPNPFQHIQLQTSGQRLTGRAAHWLRTAVGVTGVSLSLCSFSSSKNAEYTCPRSDADYVNIGEICKAITDFGLSLRICLNLTDAIDGISPEGLLLMASDIGASQLTFRRLYSGTGDSPQEAWIKAHRSKQETVDALKDYLAANGKTLPAIGCSLKRVSIAGMSVVIDDDCMAIKSRTKLRTLVLREDRRLYSRWDDKGSLIF